MQTSDFKVCNLFVGKNNVGKSSVLEAIFLACGASVPDLVFVIDAKRDLFGYLQNIVQKALDKGLGLKIENSEHYLKMIYHELDEKNSVKIDASIGNQKRSLGIKAHYNTKSLRDENTSQISENINGYVFELKTETDNLQENFVSTVEIHGAETVLHRDPKYKEIITAFFLDSESLLKTPLADLLSKASIRKEKKEIIEVLQAVDANIQNLETDSNAVIFCDTGLSKMIPLSVMGDGIKRILAIVLNLQRMKDGIALFDEIDSGLHYTALKTLWKAIFEAAKKYNVQVFATTHSAECASAYAETYLENEESAKDEIRLFRIERNNDGEHKAVKMNAETLQTLIENHLEFR